MKASGASSPARNVAGRSSPTPPTVRRFRLAGPSRRLDPRIHAIRRDIADVALAEQVFAPHYAQPLDHGCAAVRVAMRAAPAADAPAVSELLLGECFAVVDASGDWAWGFTRHDSYVGYVPVSALGPAIEPSHIVTMPAALVFAAADIKAPVVERLPMGARVAAQPLPGDFLAVPGGFVHRRHVGQAEAAASDPVAVAERLIGVPYRWGGRSGDGIDCSGLVQLAMALAGRPAPRDSDQQQAALGVAADPDGPLRRGDLLFWPGHVGMMVDAERLIHANAYWMAVTVEPLADVLARLPEASRTPAVRRLHP